MKFVVATIDGSRILCQLADMAPVIWIDARVAEAIGYSYALHFVTRRGADRCAFINNGAAVALGDWDHDTEANREVSRRSVGPRSEPIARPRTAPQDTRGVARGGPARGVQARDVGPRGGSGTDRGAGRAPLARLPPVVASDWRERGRLSRVEAAAEWEQVAR